MYTKYTTAKTKTFDQENNNNVTWKEIEIK